MTPLQSVRWRKGFQRITWIVSVCIWAIIVACAFNKAYTDREDVVVALVFGALPWSVYWLIAFIIRGFFPSDPKSESDPDSIHLKESEGIYQPAPPRPWARLFARYVDIIGIILMFCFSLGLLGHSDFTDEEFTGIAWFSLLGLVFIEGIFLSKFGTTPGKWLYGFKVTQGDGHLLTYRQSMARAASVFVKGFGIGIPLVSFITMGVAWADIVAKGAPSWDLKRGFVLQQKPIEGYKIALLVAFWGGLLLLMAVGYSME